MSRAASSSRTTPAESWTTRDGIELHHRLALPGGPPRAILLFVHGLAEHSARYLDVVEHFRPLGFACLGLDLRGHGRSSGLRVHVDTFDDYAADVSTALAGVRDLIPGRPIFLVGHSMGGVVAIRYALDHADHVDGLVLSSPGLAAHPSSAPPAWLDGIAGLISIVAPRMLFASNIDADAVSRDPEVVAAYRADRWISDRVSARWYTAFKAAQRDAFERADALRLPVLLMQSGADRLVDPAATQRWAEAAPPDLVSYYTWPNAYHEMFNEPEKRQVYELVERWLEEQLSGSR